MKGVSGEESPHQPTQELQDIHEVAADESITRSPNHQYKGLVMDLEPIIGQVAKTVSVLDCVQLIQDALLKLFPWYRAIFGRWHIPAPRHGFAQFKPK